MKILNRAAIVLRYREPFLLWAASIDEEAPEQARSLSDDFSNYLLPEDPDEREESTPVEEFFQEIFTQELEDWCPDETLWPTGRDYATFRQWFDIQATSVVSDLGSEPLESEDL